MTSPRNASNPVDMEPDAVRDHLPSAQPDTGDIRGAPAADGTNGTPSEGLARPIVRSHPLSSAQGLRLAQLGMVIVLIGAAAGVGAGFVLPTTYASRAELLYELTQYDPTGDSLRDDRALTTQALLVQSRTVLESVAAVDGIPVDDLAKKLTATVVSGSEIVQIQVDDQNRDTGVRLLTGIIQSYLGLAQINAGPQARVVVAPYSVTVPVSPGLAFTTATGGITALLIAAVVVGLLARRWSRV
jgi:Capsular polysaccharide biosynthesis protein